MNGITAFIDGSNVYGSDQTTANELRTGSQGLLKVTQIGSHEMLPLTHDDEKNQDVATAGDVRAREMNGLAAMHTLFVREHNRLARELRALRPDWNDETLYQVRNLKKQNIVFQN